MGVAVFQENYLWILKFEYHQLCTSREVFIFFFFQPFKKVQTILNWRTIQKQVVGWI